jgi:hypothetical protein
VGAADVDHQNAVWFWMYLEFLHKRSLWKVLRSYIPRPG